MSLICVHCGRTTVISNNPDHLHFCHKCNISEVTENEKQQIAESSKNFRRER